MNIESIQKMQQQLLAFQNNLVETTTSDNDIVKVIMNGKMQIVEIKIGKEMPLNELEILLKEAINKSIIQVSTKLQETMKTLSQM